MKGKRLSFWLAVGGMSILSNFALELASDKFPALGLRHFTAYTHKGTPTTANTG
jgi:hypothetical protein